MLYLYGFLGLAVLGLIYMRFEAGLVKVDRIRFTKSGKCLKVIQLSDLHVNRLKVPYDRILSVIKREAPDLILITGDFIEKKSHLPKLNGLLREMRGIENIYACLGNHDYEAFEKDPAGLKNYMEQLQMLGISLLQNQCISIEKNSKKI